MEAGSLSASRAPKILLGIPLGLLAALIALVLSIGLIFGASPNCGGSSTVGGLSSKVPSRLVPIYEAAASRYGLGGQGPAILAAINEVETDFGTNMGPSSAGAIGWMQFEPSTWAIWGVDADHDGRKDPYDPWDAIFAAARYLRASGAPGDWGAAILAYNHAGWYVAEVLAEAKRFQGTSNVETAGFGDCAAADLAQRCSGCSPRRRGSTPCTFPTSGAAPMASPRLHPTVPSIAPRPSLTCSRSVAFTTRRWTPPSWWDGANEARGGRSLSTSSPTGPKRTPSSSSCRG